MRVFALAAAVACALACKVRNEQHCANHSGDETCVERGEGTPYCDVCLADRDGCVAEPVADPACAADTVADSASGSSGEGSSGIGATSTTTGASSTTTTATSDETTAVGSDGPDPICGDGVVGAGEICDGDDLGGLSCEALGLMGGTLACGSDCASFDTAGCRGVATCGNGIIEGNESCDGRNLDGATCADLPQWAGGELACDETCSLDTSACTPCKESTQSCDADADCCDEQCSGLGLCL